MQLIEGQKCVLFLCFVIKSRQIDKLEQRVLELEGQIKMEEMCVYIYIYIYTHTYTHTHTHTHTNTHTYIYAYTHTSYKFVISYIYFFLDIVAEI